MNKLPLVAIVSILYLLSIPSLLFACSCIGVSHIESSVRAADAVFEGKIISTQIIRFHELGSEIAYKQYKVKVTQDFKNAKRNKIITVTTGIGHGDCGFEFLVGKKYIFYAKFENKYYNYGPIVPKYLYTDICTRTQKTNTVECKLIKYFIKYGRINELYSDF